METMYRGLGRALSGGYLLALCAITLAPGLARAQTSTDRSPGLAHVRAMSDDARQRIIAETEGVGRLPGNFAVDAKGQANYTVPVTLPPAGNKLEPSLQLVYNSQLTRTYAGWGWALAGMSDIRRCPATFAHDNRLHSPDLTDADEFCLNGAKLRLVSGRHGTDGAVYRPLVDDQSKIVIKGQLGQGPRSFVVYKKTGQILEFGGTDDSRVGGTAGVVTWGLSSLRDRNGNTVNYQYAGGSDHELIPASVSYGGNAAGVAHYRRVVFDYRDHPFPLVRYRAGIPVRSDQELYRIRVESRGELLWSYNLEHETATPDVARIVRAIERCTPNACQSATRFSYEELEGEALKNTGEFDAEFTYDNEWDHEQSVRILSDLDSDGYEDLIAIRRREVSARFGSANGLGPVQELDGFAALDFDLERSAVHVVDIDRDGHGDLVTFNEGSTLVAFGAERDFIDFIEVDDDALNTWSSERARSSRYIIDLDRDGLADVVAFNGGATEIRRGTGLRGNPFAAAPEGPFEFADDESRALGYRGPVDVDGDGYVDLLLVNEAGIFASFGGEGGFAAPLQLRGPFGSPSWLSEAHTQVGDVNGDGKVDLVTFDDDGIWASLGTGASFGLPVLWSDVFSFNQGFDRERHQMASIDFNYDGIADFFGINDTHISVVINGGSPYRQSEVRHDLPAGRIDYQYDRIDFGDVNADGRHDLILFLESANLAFASRLQGHRLVSVEDGFGFATDVTWSSAADDPHTPASGPSGYPTRPLAGPMRVVTRVGKDDGLGGTRYVEYLYSGALFHEEGMGFLGFRSFSETDKTSGVRVTRFLTQHPELYQLGLEEAVTTALVDDDGERLLSREDNRYETIPVGNGFQIANSRQEIKQYDLDGQLISTRVTTRSFDELQNVTNTTTTTTDEHGTYVIETLTQYRNDRDRWIVGLPLRTTVRRSRTGSPAIERVSSYEYDRETGDLQRSVLMPGTRFERSTEYDRSGNVFGHSDRVTIRVADASGRESDTSTSVKTYDEEGFLRTSANDLGHTITTVAHPHFGAAQATRNPNGGVAATEYNGWGEGLANTSEDGERSILRKGLCAGAPHCPTGAAYFVARLRDGAPTTWTYLDALEREVRKVSEAPNGQLVVVDTEYLANGLRHRQSQPYFVGDSPSGWTIQEYDELLRLSSVQRPDGSIEMYEYAGGNTTLVDANGNATTRTTNAIGEKIRAVDADGNALEIRYDAFGNPIETIDPAGNRTISEYDVLGRRIRAEDPDAGASTFQVNGFGDLVRTTDAAGRVTRYEYDGIGRQVLENQGGVITTTTYDQAENGIGQVSAAVRGDLGLVKTYDSLGRVRSVAQAIDGSDYTTTYEYDGGSRPSRTVFSSGLALRYAYDATGRLQAVVDERDGATLWRFESANASGQLTSSLLGNGVRETRSYYPETQRLEGIRAAVAGRTVHRIAVDYDNAGNVVLRKNGTTGEVETFSYDRLNRMIEATSSVYGDESVRYDALGNITSRRTAGQERVYVYGTGCGGPHAVCEVNGARTDFYAYDDAGRLTDGRGRQIDYNYVGKPTEIRKGGFVTRFRYGPGNVRKVRIDSNGSDERITHYVNQEHEVLFDGGKTVHRHRLGAFEVEIVEAEQTRRTQYLHTDHLGSVTTVTDEDGQVVEQHAFDPWGLRRAEPGSQSRDTWDPQGFTGHEHADGVELIHMNGRAYDPVLARFISPDPLIQDPTNLQSYNRYTYVWNNPLTRVDPSGYFSIKGIVRAVGDGLQALGNALIGQSATERLSNWLSRNEHMIYATALAVASYGVASSASLALSTFAKYTVVAAGGFAGGYIQSGGDLKTAGISALTAAAFYGVGQAFKPPVGAAPGQYILGSKVSSAGAYAAAKVAAHGTVGGLASAARGGDFASGFVSSAVSKSLFVAADSAGINLAPTGSKFANVAVQAVFGGTTAGLAAEAVGGDFESAFTNGAMATLFNRAMSELNGEGKPVEQVRKKNVYAIGVKSLSGSVMWGHYETGDMYAWLPGSDEIHVFRYEFYGAGTAGFGVGGALELGVGWAYEPQDFGGMSIGMNAGASPGLAPGITGSFSYSPSSGAVVVTHGTLAGTPGASINGGIFYAEYEGTIPTSQLNPQVFHEIMKFPGPWQRTQ